MVSEVIIPVMDQTTETVLLTRWLKRPGEPVRKGEAVCEIDTDKATVEIEAGADGVLRKVLIESGTHIPPRTVVGLIASADEALPDVDPYHLTPASRPEPAAAASSAPSAHVAASGPAPSSQERKVSPRARRLAEEHGIDLADVHGSGPDGRIVEDDVKAAIQRGAQPTTASAAARVAQAKAERVGRSWRTIPHFHMSMTADLARIVDRKAAAGDRITYTDLFIHAIAQTLARHPALNGHWQDDRLVVIPDIRLGLVVQTERGLVIPAMRDVRGRPLDDIATEREQLVAQAHAGRLAPAATLEPTFTLSNVGPGHIDHFAAIISPPQVAILAVGSIQPRPQVVASELAIRPTATFTLGVDHRAIDGRDAAAFLEQLKISLESQE
jgi:pyruvate dehydrogenase E2 component (dihydrolipoamide acetyltransferase)